MKLNSSRTKFAVLQRVIEVNSLIRRDVERAKRLDTESDVSTNSLEGSITPLFSTATAKL